MVLQLDPRFPLVWRSPSSLQLGVDDPRAVLHDVTNARERMISALVTGISRPGLGMVATAAGSDDAEASRLLREVGGALRPPSTSSVQRSVTIAGHGATVERMAEAFAWCGIAPRLVGLDAGAAGESDDIGIVVAHFVIDPDFFGVWLRRDRPHLPVIFGDEEVRIGPIVEPGTGPCLYCLDRRRTDADPAWPAMASQLWGRRSALDGGLVAGEVTAIATRVVLHRLALGEPGAAASVRLDAATGATSTQTWRRHPDCGCAALPGIATDDEGSIAAARPRPRTGATAAGPA